MEKLYYLSPDIDFKWHWDYRLCASRTLLKLALLLSLRDSNDWITLRN